MEKKRKVLRPKPTFFPPGGKKMLGYKLHFNDPNPQQKHRANTMMCVVCKEYVEYWNWAHCVSGYYPMCDSCFDRHKWIVLHVPHVGLPESDQKIAQSIAKEYVTETESKQ